MKTRISGLPEGKYFICAGKGRAKTLLTSFDAALLDAGVGNYNLLKVSSILPEGFKEATKVELPEGSLLPIAYGAVSDFEDGKRITAAIAVGIPDRGVGVIMEYSGALPEDEAKEKVEAMAREALELRGVKVLEIKSKVVSTIVKGPTTVFAGVALW